MKTVSSLSLEAVLTVGHLGVEVSAVSKRFQRSRGPRTNRNFKKQRKPEEQEGFYDFSKGTEAALKYRKFQSTRRQPELTELNGKWEDRKAKAEKLPKAETIQTILLNCLFIYSCV